MAQKVLLTGDSIVLNMKNNGGLKRILSEKKPEWTFDYDAQPGQAFHTLKFDKIKSFQPNLLLVHTGTNDAANINRSNIESNEALTNGLARVERYIRKYYDDVKKNAPNTAIAFITPFYSNSNADKWYANNNVKDEVSKLIRKVANEKGCKVYDINKDYAKYFINEESKGTKMYADGIHLTTKGSQKLEEFISSYLLNESVTASADNKTVDTVTDCQPVTDTSTNSNANTTSNAPLVNVGNLKLSRRNIKELIVHCTADPEGKSNTVEAIRQFHTAPKSQGGRGWRDIGYNYVIYLDGSIHEGRDVNIAGAHTEGHNSISIGISYVGGMDRNNKNPKDTRTPAQKSALLSILKKLKQMYPTATIHGHREYANKACPSFDAKAEYANI